jgi:hypothetical protein
MELKSLRKKPMLSSTTECFTGPPTGAVRPSLFPVTVNVKTFAPWGTTFTL